MFRRGISNPSITNNSLIDGYPVGVTTVTWNATDFSGNSASDTQLVTLEDTTSPTIISPLDMIIMIEETEIPASEVDLGIPIVYLMIITK